jgi:hypothetical protein
MVADPVRGSRASISVLLTISSTFLLILSLTPSLVVRGDYCGRFLDNPNLVVFTPDTLDLRTAPKNPTYTFFFDFQGLRLQINSQNGKLEVIFKVLDFFSFSLFF